MIKYKENNEDARLKTEQGKIEKYSLITTAKF